MKKAFLVLGLMMILFYVGCNDGGSPEDPPPPEDGGRIDTTKVDTLKN